MKIPALLIAVAASLSCLNAAAEEGWQSTRLIPDFYAEGAAVGDINGDDQVDIAYGPFLLAGPDFDKPLR